MPSRRRPKLPPAPPLTDAERFAKAVRNSEAAARTAVQDEKDRQAGEERRKVETAEARVRLEQAKLTHQQAVEAVRTAKRTGRGAAEADRGWRLAKANLLELETGERPAWAPILSAPEAGSETDGADGTDETAAP